ncbi:Sapep family Mn(2+)-dependent dipeptidase [Paenibacillus sp. FSL R7-0331]|uniref:Sapep family Mn(2+)-dependent dipeptidase n=1 Tax=Paenibacillus sp. FSL R7-0331 TaxID=1536773 RepID=UPI0006947AA1|nr:Sapep family Mn(2+)-dependent dipeptidase [Paenibacillus sp. FSL R7-0331]
MSYIGAKVRAYEQQMIAQLQALIRINSAASEPLPGMPEGQGVAEALAFVLQLGRELGFRVRSVDGYAGHIEYGEGEEMAAVLTHVDTVPAGDGWTYPPLAAQIVDGNIYGRGASDNKYAVIAAIYSLYALKEAGIKPNRRLRVIFGTKEETGMTDMDYYFAREPLPLYGFVTDGPYPICNAEKGSIVLELQAEFPAQAQWLEADAGLAPNMVPDYACASLHGAGGETERLEAAGQPGHGAYPHGGRNSITLLIRQLTGRLPEWTAAGELPAAAALLTFADQQIGAELDGRSLGIAYDDKEHGAVTVNVALLRLSRTSARLTLDIRYPAGMDGDSIFHSVRGQAEQSGLSVHLRKHLPALYVDPESELIRRLARAYETVIGETAVLISMAGGTYAKKLQNTGVIFGPAFPGAPPTRYHQADEHIGIDQMLLHAEVCTQALYELSR